MKLQVHSIHFIADRRLIDFIQNNCAVNERSQELAHLLLDFWLLVSDVRDHVAQNVE